MRRPGTPLLRPSMTIKFHWLSAIALALVFVASHADVVCNNRTSFETGVTGAFATGTTSTPTTFMGDAHSLAASTDSITGFDVLPFYISGATTCTGLTINSCVWGTANTGTVSAAAPASAICRASAASRPPAPSPAAFTTRSKTRFPARRLA